MLSGIHTTDSKIVFHGPIDKPELDIRAVYENTKATEQFGTVTSSPIQVVLTVTGDPNNPEITLRLYENGTEMLGNDATSDAITYLLFGKYKNELSASETQSVASGIGSTVGSLYVTSFFGQVVRNMLPFIKDAELNYSEGGIQNTNVSVSSEILDADVTVGSRVITVLCILICLNRYIYELQESSSAEIWFQTRLFFTVQVLKLFIN